MVLIPKPVFDHARFDRWKQILDQFDTGEITDTTASKMLEDLRQLEKQQFEEICRKTK